MPTLRESEASLTIALGVLRVGVWELSVLHTQEKIKSSLYTPLHGFLGIKTLFELIVCKSLIEEPGQSFLSFKISQLKKELQLSKL
jgi:hypothetical protein